MKILVADDSKTNLALITASLQKLGHDVMTVMSGDDVLVVFKKQHPDLIILDVVMKEMDGFECAKKIRAIEGEDWIPIIFLSSSVDDISIAKGISAGGDDYLTKPFSEITLEAKIKAMQRIAEMRKRLYETTQELLILSSTDPLTGVYNRLQFEKTLKEKLSEADRHHYILSLLFVDLDHFKTINDTIGHHIGDLLLKEVANRIKSCIRLEDFVARIGGDEFVIIISNIEEPSNAQVVAQKILQTLAPAYHLKTHVVRVSASIGIACYPHESTTYESFVQNADIAMYHAKSLGRNNYQYFTRELSDRYRQQINLEQDLKFALENNELYIVYQPIYNLLTKKIIAVEALLRWQHPRFGLISPNIFIPIAEEMGLIMEIGSWVLKTVCFQGERWNKKGVKELKLAVNLSLQQLLQDNFLQSTEEILSETHFPSKSLQLELTENSVITYTQQLKQTMKKLHELGLEIAIDDFGTRYSSLTTLGALPINTLKIDRIFLNDVTIDPKNKIIVKSLIALGNNLNLNVVAEGVQSEEQLQFLILNGCLQGQGFFLCNPLNIEQMTELLIAERDKYMQSITQKDG